MSAKTMMNSAERGDIQGAIIETAERLFRQIGFQKTTVADIAADLHMSPANVYRFFAMKAEIEAAVCRGLFGEIEAGAERIARSSAPAREKLRNVITAVVQLNAQRFQSDRKLHELFETAYRENWPIAREHADKMDKILAQIIRRGMAAGEFRPGDADLAAVLVGSACVRFCHPRLMVECADPKPTSNQMIDFCLAALA
jgi:AcrR family transcriptional regulator